MRDILAPEKYFKLPEVERLLKIMKAQAQSSRPRAQRRWLVTDLLLGSGLRCMEAANLKIKDCHTGYGDSYIHVSKGKGDKKRNVLISQELKKHINDYIKNHCQKDQVFLIKPERGIKYTENGIFTLTKRIIIDCGLPSHYSTHCFRHTYATLVYRHTKDILFVARQLGHASIDTTMIYAHIFYDRDSDRLKGLFNVK